MNIMKKDDLFLNDKQMIGGCCVCADDSGYCDNPLVYCDGDNCNVAVHQACYGIVTVPEGPWFCRKCEVKEKSLDASCCLCPSKEGAMKRTDANSWAHVICALYIPEITFTNVRTMEPIVTSNIRSDRLNKKCHICEQQNRHDTSEKGVCVGCSKTGCKLWFHVTCAQKSGLLCEDHSLPGNNVKYCIYCKTHQAKLNNNDHIKLVPAFRLTCTLKSSASVSKKSKSNEKIVKKSDKKNDKLGKLLVQANDATKSSVLSAKDDLYTDNDAEEPTMTLKQLIKEEKSNENQRMTINNILSSKDKSTALALAELSTKIKTEEIAPLSVEVDTKKSTKKSKKINAMSPTNNQSQQHTNIPSVTSTKSQSKRKSIDSKSIQQASPNAKRRKQAQEEDTHQLDVFGNHLNPNAELSSSLKTTFEQEKLLINMSDVQKKPESSLNKLLNQSSLIIGPSLPILENGYSVLNEENHANTSKSNVLPETLEDLLLKKWSMDTEFLMDQSQNFDVTVLLTGLYQTKKENKELENKIVELSKKRDHLMIMNAKLALPLEYHKNLVTTKPFTPPPPPLPVPSIQQQQQQEQPVAFAPTMSQVQKSIPQLPQAPAHKPSLTTNLNLTNDDLNILKSSPKPIQTPKSTKTATTSQSPPQTNFKKSSTDFSINNIQSASQPIDRPLAKNFPTYTQHYQQPQSLPLASQQVQHHEETRKFEKLNKLLSNQTNNGPMSTTSNEYASKPSAYVTPVMIKKQQQQQQQNQNFFNNRSVFNPFDNSNQQPQQTQSSISTANSTLVPNFNQTSSTPSVSSSNPSNDVYYPLQNILLTPSLTLNYGWQNLLQHVDASNANSMLSIIPHFSNLDLMNLASQTNQQHQQQQQASNNTLTSSSSNSTTTSASNSQQQQHQIQATPIN